MFLIVIHCVTEFEGTIALENALVWVKERDTYSCLFPRLQSSKPHKLLIPRQDCFVNCFAA